ncbi:MAG: hydrogenase maturation nickel metallochaperone HypA [Planctomycetota bacterium]
MHEMSIATTLIGQVLHQAAAHDLERVERIRLEIGAQRLVVYEAMRMAFSAVAAGTCAAGAQLELVEIPVRARCRACVTEFAPAIDDYRCPDCGEADVLFIAGDDIVLAALEGERATD